MRKIRLFRVQRTLFLLVVWIVRIIVLVNHFVKEVEKLLKHFVSRIGFSMET